MASAPPWMTQRDAVDDRDRYAAMTPEQRLAVFVEVCELARTIIESRPDRTAILAENEPMPAAAAATWQRLVAEARHARSSR
ncbi:MAG: hypothetical protein D6760_01875 [Deltaproteobacteria bacterium]|nr:MAG: hypothetical protein D6760_01875 [Deltaproteobacteria bacterium]